MRKKDQKVPMSLRNMEGADMGMSTSDSHAELILYYYAYPGKPDGIKHVQFCQRDLQWQCALTMQLQTGLFL